MSKRFFIKLARENPLYVVIDFSGKPSNSVIALDIQVKLQFQEASGEFFHEYALPYLHDIVTSGGYVDKILKYRSQRVEAAIAGLFKPDGLNVARRLPVLAGRSLLVDILLTKMIYKLLSDKLKSKKAILFDHGCTVAEHYDMLDQMLSAYCGLSAAESLSYIGLDNSPFALSGARVLHPGVVPDDFRLILAEGSDIGLADDSVDFAMSVGVVNHVHRPLETLDKLLRITRTALVLVLWVTGEDEGFWAYNHNGLAFYFFSARDLAALGAKYSDKGAFYFSDFTPERNATQPNSYVGISDERLDLLGSYTLVFTHPPYVLDEMNPIEFTGSTS